MKKLMYTFLLLAYISFAFVGCGKGTNEPPTQSETGMKPLASGTFWQIGTGRLATWTDGKLSDEVAVVRDMGMDVILIQYSAHWDALKKAYQTFVPNNSFELYPGLSDRDPLGAIFRAAERTGVKIIVGDFLTPPPLRYEQPKLAFEYWLSTEAMEFRRTIIERYKDSPSFYGYYISNEPNPRSVQSPEDKNRWIQSTKEVTNYIKSLKSDLKIVHSIGLYAEWVGGGPTPPSRAYLDAFWRPWVSELNNVDIWMVIDGIGTSMSVLSHTGMAQEWGKELAHSHNKEFWVDVENAVMTTEFKPFPIEKLAMSLGVAARHADKIVLFEHLSYMSPNSSNPDAPKLYSDYLQYRETILAR